MSSEQVQLATRSLYSDDLGGVVIILKMALDVLPPFPPPFYPYLRKWSIFPSVQ